MPFRTTVAFIALLSACRMQPARVPAEMAAQDGFWAALQSICGGAYAGRLVEGNASDSAFRTAELRMHVRSCAPTEVRIPFHLGANASRTWVITRTAAGLRLKHDHRHEDGSEDAITQYGGDTRTAGTIARQEFYADSHTATLIPAARTNIWTIEVMPGDRFAYALRREGTDRRFRVEFDLRKPVATPPPPWGAVGLDPIVIRNITVIPMTGASPSTRQSVIVRNGRIAEIGPSARLRIPAGATVVDGTGKYLIPGLFEMHAHTSKTRASALGLYVMHGVTTIRDQGSEHAEVLRWRREIRAGTRVGPRMLIAGPYLESLRNVERMRRDPPEARVEPFERARIPIGSPADARRVIDSLATLELDHFKIRTVQDRETYLAIAKAAHAHGKRLVGHIVTASPALFLEAGQDGVDHGFPITIDSLPREQRMVFWRELAARDVGVVPTLVVATESVFRPLDYFQALMVDTTGALHPLRPYVSAFLILDWREQVEEVTPERRSFFERAWPIALKHFREMREAGVRIMAGADVAVLNIFPGASLHEELRLFVDSLGMSPMEALASATRQPAEWLGLADSVGTIAVDKVADLVLLDADPLSDINNTRRIAAVVLRGRLFQRRDLDALLAAVGAMPDRRVNDWVR